LLFCLCGTIQIFIFWYSHSEELFYNQQVKFIHFLVPFGSNSRCRKLLPAIQIVLSQHLFIWEYTQPRASINSGGHVCSYSLGYQQRTFCFISASLVHYSDLWITVLCHCLSRVVSQSQSELSHNSSVSCHCLNQSRVTVPVRVVSQFIGVVSLSQSESCHCFSQGCLTIHRCRVTVSAGSCRSFIRPQTTGWIISLFCGEFDCHSLVL